MKLRKFDHNLLAAVVVLCASIIGFAASSFLLNSQYKDIPFGFLLSGGIVSLTYVACYLLIKIDEKNATVVGSMISIIMRLVILITITLLLAFMYYRWNIRLFNLFVFVGVYTFGTLIFVLSFVISKKGKE